MLTNQQFEIVKNIAEHNADSHFHKISQLISETIRSIGEVTVNFTPQAHYLTVQLSVIPKCGLWNALPVETIAVHEAPLTVEIPSEHRLDFTEDAIKEYNKIYAQNIQNALNTLLTADMQAALNHTTSNLEIKYKFVPDKLIQVALFQKKRY